MANFLNWFKSEAPQPGTAEDITGLKSVPQHVAVIMDGNGRWASERGLPRTAGHKAGVERVRDAVTLCLDTGVKYLTLYAFSTENWTRPREEVNFLMRLFEDTLAEEVRQLHERGVRVKFIGFRENLSSALLKLIEDSEAKTCHNEALVLTFAINYGGRPEIVNACKMIARAAQTGALDPESIDEALFSDYLFTAGLPDPDLLVKPGKELRISNFLIWQMAYTEFYFSEIYWPDFGRAAMIEAFKCFGRKERRFGGLKRGDTSE